MKDSEEITMETFKNFIRNTLNLNLKKREEHALFVLLDTNKNNKIAKDEFMLLMTKGEKLLDAPPQPKVNNFLDEDLEESKRKESLYRSDSSTQYSGNPKTELIKTIHASGMLSIEEFLNKK
jgi:Ca2+-binding EF-hand superfamily protein